MSHTIMVPVTGQGTVVDQSIAKYLPSLMESSYGFSELFFYSHGWWTSALSAMVDYSKFSVGMLEQIVARATKQQAAPPSALQVGIHWPSMASEEQNSIINVLQPLTFYNRAKMADDVGEHGGGAVLQLAVDAANKKGKNLRVHLIGHSFGCRVVAASLTSLLANMGAAALKNHSFNMVLLQGAFDSNALAPGGNYEALLASNGVPNLRILVTTSNLDKAVGKDYPLAYKLVHLFGKTTTGIGATGPTGDTPGVGQATKIPVDAGFAGDPQIGPTKAKFVVADLSPVHQARNAKGLYEPTSSGNHSDIYTPEVYDLIDTFLY